VLFDRKDGNISGKNSIAMPQCPLPMPNGMLWNRIKPGELK
jgi:hypothetical protein